MTNTASGSRTVTGLPAGQVTFALNFLSSVTQGAAFAGAEIVVWPL